MEIGNILSKAIKSSKWVKIDYLNKKNENTSYWIAIKDIDHSNKKLYVSMFNENKSTSIFETWIEFSRILNAEILEFSSYDEQLPLIEKIEKNLALYDWLNYDKFNNNVLNYYIECNYFDNDPFQKEYDLIPGIDLEKLRENKEFKLNDYQIKRIVADIYKYDLNKKDNSYNVLAINSLSIDIDKKKYIVCYYSLTFDPEKKALIVSNELKFNKSFFVKGRRHSLFDYINMDEDTFTKDYVNNVSEYKELIRSNLRYGELINDRPDIMLLQRDIHINLAETYSAIEKKYEEGCLPIPLKAFFGNITRRDNVRRKEPSIVIYDKKINIDQMRVLYNALKYPVTYVQGPPGTGKTQTIINVLLSCFYNDKTILICSSNNKPINGIMEKLEFEHNGDKVPFPFLRLGNQEDVKKATLKIKELYAYTTTKEPKEHMLNNIKNVNDDKNARLIEVLGIQDKRVEIEDCIETSKKFLNSFKNNENKTLITIKEKVDGLNTDLEKLPNISNEELVSLVKPLKGDFQLSQFLFFKSLQYIQKLKKPKYAQLVSICKIEDDETRVTEFNKWSKDDDNMKLLTDVFPIILSTNISSQRLGTPDFTFNLVVMDEAGQCNVATALVPITKAGALLLVGDPNQLKPVIVLDDLVNNQLIEKYNVATNYNYKDNSILSIMRANDRISKYISLKYHYRCGRKIIDFSNKRYYDNILNLSHLVNDGELKLLDIKNNNSKHKNEAIEEAIEIVSYIKRNDIHDVSIITPFVRQRELIKKLLEEQNILDVEVGTIHSLQGAEKSTIIFSPAISSRTSKNTFAWLKNNSELINVAVTRAQKKLIIAADTKQIERLSDKNDDLYTLIEYVKNNGNVSTPKKENIKIEIGKSNGSLTEDKFYETVSHFCSCNTSFDVMRNVSVGKIIKNLQPSEMNLEFDAVLFKKTLFSKVPVIAFEVNGAEHIGRVSREKADRKKMDICKRNNIDLVIIPNDLVKSYEYVLEVIKASKNKVTTIQQSLFGDIDANLTEENNIKKGTIVTHRTYGNGIVISLNKKRNQIKVRFSDVEKLFVYEAVDVGTLTIKQ